MGYSTPNDPGVRSHGYTLTSECHILNVKHTHLKNVMIIFRFYQSFNALAYSHLHIVLRRFYEFHEYLKNPHQNRMTGTWLVLEGENVMLQMSVCVTNSLLNKSSMNTMPLTRLFAFLLENAVTIDVITQLTGNVNKVIQYFV